MQGKILIVDAIATNRIVLKVKLASAYYQVLQADTLAQAAYLAVTEVPDLIVSALNLPDGSAGALCTRLQTGASTQHISVLAIADTPCSGDRLAALEEGVLDVLSKPLDDTLLLGRIRSLIRAQNVSAEWRMREDTSVALGMSEPAVDFAQAGHVMMISPDSAPHVLQWRSQLRPLLHAPVTLSKGGQLLNNLQDGRVPDIFVLVPPAAPELAAASLRLISTLRANATTRYSGVMMVQNTPNPGVAAQALDLGADDVMIEGFDAMELAVRIKTLRRRIQKDAQLRETYQNGLQAAVQDPLTGLHNRRYAMPHLNRISSHANATGKPYAVMVADLDHFKQINDVYGHASGDAVLVEVADRLRSALRAMDMVARIGGEEFMIVMPGTTPEEAQNVAIRICNDISATPFAVPGSDKPVEVTVSIGMAIGDSLTSEVTESCRATALLDQADKALYSAKMRGRNRVTLGRPAA